MFGWQFVLKPGLKPCRGEDCSPKTTNRAGVGGFGDAVGSVGFLCWLAAASHRKLLEAVKLRVTLSRAAYYVLLCCAVLWMLLVVVGIIVLAPAYPGPIGAIALVVAGLILGIPFFACIGIGVWLHRRPVAPSLPPPQPAPAAAPQPAPPPSGSVVIREREVVLIVCPSCGTKNPQGRHKCSNCGANL